MFEKRLKGYSAIGYYSHSPLKDAWIQNNIRLVLYIRKQHFRFQQIKLNYNLQVLMITP